MKNFIGINGHFTFKPELYKQVCRLVRNYHNLDWDVKNPGDKVTFPICVNKVNWKNDVYGKWKQDGFQVDICAQFGGFGHGNPKYLELWKSNAQWAYTYGFNMATYFGPSGKEKLCTSIEIDNEPGIKFDSDLYKNIFINMANGIRAGDKKVKIVTSASKAGPGNDYIMSLQDTFGSPDMKPLYDVINMHVYAEKPREKGRSPWDRSFPEDPNISYLKEVDDTIAWRNINAADKEIWITEFGWDACTDEAMKKRTGWFEKLDWRGVTELQQAQYLVRSLMCFAERDVARAYIYYYDDNDSPSVHGSSGLTRRFKPKMAFWAVKHFYDTLGEYRFNRIVTKDDGNLYVYEFVRGDDNNAIIWAAWSPTCTNQTKEVTINNLPREPLYIERMSRTEGTPPKIEWKKINADSISVTISEDTIFIFINK